MSHQRLTIRQAFHVSPDMDAALRKAAAEESERTWRPISVSDWIRGAIAARLAGQGGLAGHPRESATKEGGGAP